jgi:hypothetical protein
VSRFTDLPSGERAVYVRETAARLNITQQIVEKDFWVCWTLKLLFSRPEFAPHVVFKGGTSLSKVFKVIGRFSEDIDLSIGLPLLGYDDSFLTADTSPTQMRRHIERVEAKCAAFVKNEFRVTLENTIRDELGQRSGGGNWLEYQVEGATKSPVLVFRYPAVIPPEAGASYIEQSVKMELGSLTDQRPVGRHRIAPLIAEIVAEGDFEDFSGEVVALEVERTFWEKATILHAEFHRPETQALKDRMARHYADFADLWKHPAGVPARAQFDLLARVVAFKSRYYPSKWARYDLARPGTLRLCPPATRKPELAEDYRRMAVMYFQEPLSFLEILTTLQQAETEINSRKQ